MSNTLTRYYQSFNAGNYQGMLDLLTEDVVHEPSQGKPRHGKSQFTAFLKHMETCYLEQVIDPVFMLSADGQQAAAEFMLQGKYLVTDGDLPAARGQSYSLRVGTFFELVQTPEGERISRVSNHYNLEDWIAQVAA